MRPHDEELREPIPAGPAGRTMGDIMTPGVVSVTATASVADAAERMRDHNIGDVLVADDGHVLGVITDRDLVVRVLGAHRSPENTTVREVCSPNMISVSPDTPVEQGVSLMREHAIRRLPVIGPDGYAFGMVTIGDLAMTEDSRSALADISAASPNV